MRKKHLVLVGVAVVAWMAFLAIRAWWTPTREVLREVVRGDLDLREGVLYVHGAKEPFQGVLIEDFSKGVRKLAIDIRQGRADGVSRGWFENGQLEVEETFVAGVSHGLRTRWHANGKKKSEEHIEHGVVTGRYVEWFDNGQKAVEMVLQAGHPEGLAEAWYPDGTRKSQTQFADGKIVKREFFPAPLTAAQAAPEGLRP